MHITHHQSFGMTTNNLKYSVFSWSSLTDFEPYSVPKSMERKIWWLKSSGLPSESLLQRDAENAITIFCEDMNIDFYKVFFPHVVINPWNYTIDRKFCGCLNIPQLGIATRYRTSAGFCDRGNVRCAAWVKLILFICLTKIEIMLVILTLGYQKIILSPA